MFFSTHYKLGSQTWTSSKHLLNSRILRSSILFARFDWWFAVLTNSRILNSTFFRLWIDVSACSFYISFLHRVFLFDDIFSEIHLWYSMLMMDLLTSLSPLGSMNWDLNSSSVNRSRNVLLSMTCTRPTGYGFKIDLHVWCYHIWEQFAILWFVPDSHYDIHIESGALLLEGDVDPIFMQSTKVQFCVVNVWKNWMKMNSFLSRTWINMRWLLQWMSQ